MTTKYWQARAYEAETREMELREVLLYWRDECSGNEPSLSVFNRMVDAALAKDDDPEPRFELEE